MDQFCSSVVEVFPCSGCFITVMSVHFPAVELYNGIRFNTFYMLTVFLQHSSKWVPWFGCFVQYTSGLEVSAYNFDTDLNYVPNILQLCPSLTIK